MKNREFYKEEILGFMTKADDFCEEFAMPKILGSYGLKCDDVNCGYCDTLRTLWLEEEYEPPAEPEPEVDWSKVEVDTPILVSDDKNEWIERHFACFKNGKVYAWGHGVSSWTAIDEDFVWSWKYAKLAGKE